jgi:hypothetical protein
MGFVYEEEELELTYKGVAHKFRQPSAYEQKEMSKKFKAADENTDAVDVYIEFFKQLGLPEEVLGKMSLKGLLDLFGYAVGTKKN